jgi:hypothetical protein
MFSQPHRLDVKRSQGSLQQQARRPDNRAQQQCGSTPELQPRQRQPQSPDRAVMPRQQMGEGSYEGRRDYQENIQNAEGEALPHTRAPGQ